jgi:Ca2+-dependent lipid-binding protein
MADEELNKGTDAASTQDEAQETQDVTDTEAAKSAEREEKVPENQDDRSTSEDSEQEESDQEKSDEDDLDLPLEKIDELLSAADVDKNAVSPQLRRVAQRQAENSKRVEESIKNTKANPVWFVPLFCFLMILGLAWAVVYYLTTKYPIPGIGAWNLLIAFCIVMVGFIMTMWWR